MGSTPRSFSTDSSSPLLSLRDVIKSYGRRRVLEIPSLDLATGARVAILGTNGSGKSTLLRLVAGVSLPTSGRITRAPLCHRARVGFVPQFGGTNPEETVLENLQSMALLYDHALSHSGIHALCMEAFSLERYLDQRVGSLSGGYQKLVSLTAVLGVEPDILFLDEATSGLDQNHIDALRSIIDGKKSNLQLLVATDHEVHDLFHYTENITLVSGKLQ